MAKKNEIKAFDSNCLNCGFPFSGQENFCPECGQKNKGSELTFGSFINELFNGFISWDAKFWTTIIPLLTKPGKVSLDYVSGKRNRYTNPFRFYLTVSVIFFLIIGLSSRYNDFKKLSNPIKKTANAKTDVPIDSIVNLAIKNTKPALDSVKKKKDFNMQINNIKIAGLDFSPFMKFQKKHPKMDIDTALDSLHVDKTFLNRFKYSRAEAMNRLFSKNGEGDKFGKEIIGDISIALFILLPLFTLFLKLLYIRRKKTYVAHLVFVFHTQTVFFLLLTLFFLFSFTKTDGGDYIGVFLLLFLLYLYLAMKKFYQQGYFKTFIKFILANMVFFFLSLFGGIIVSAIALLMF